jgi:DNA polymerase III alpha subunit
MRIRTGYSFRTAAGHLNDVMSRLQECGYPVAPISDRCSTFGFNRWTKLAKKAGLKPLYGVELAVVPKLGESKPIIDYWTFFAKHDLRSLHDIIGLATDNPGREPSITYTDALAANGLIKIAGERVRLECITDVPPDLYVALSPSMPKGLYKAVNERGLSWVASSNNVYPRKDDQEFYRVMLGRRADTQTYPQYILDILEWSAAVSWFASDEHREKAWDNFAIIIDACNATMKKAKLLRPEKPTTLREMCIEGAQRTGTNLNDPVYAARLEKELKLIEEKKFEDYFYIIADLVRWAKARMIVGPARGSSCGSLVCYLLDITSIDPIPYGLIFERFIDINRMDLPDIDIDFSDAQRYLVFEYAAKKYGQAHVARLGTIGIFRPRSVLNQAGIALRIPKWMVQKVSDSVIERSLGDSRAMQALEDTLKDTEAGKQLLKEFPEINIAQRMEGHPNNASQHAAGIVITEEPITEFVAVDARTNSVMCDKKDAEDLELLKIDALGLTQLSIFERTLQLIGEPTISGWLEKVPLDDQKAFDVLNNGHFAGIFQFNGMALQSLTKQVRVQNIDDIISITALARPGPISTGGATAWVHRRNGKEPVTHVHPILEQSTKDTYGVVIYQEQVMNIMRSVGKLSWEDTSTLRKAMSRSMGNEYFEGFWERFKVGALEQGLEEREARAIWDQVNKFGSWAFNKAHAVAYGFVSYWCCWLKAHHPLEFAAATLDAESDPMKQIHILRELKEEGIDYKPVDPLQSTDKWVPGEVGDNKQRMLLGPLTQIKGIGPAYVKEILTARERDEPIRDALMKRLKNATTAIDSLYPIADAINESMDGKIQSTPMAIKLVQPGLEDEVVIVGVLKKIAPKDENEAQNVAKRGGRVLSGPVQALNLFIMDDSDEIFAKVDRFDYETLGRQIVEMGKPGKAIWALKGTVPKGFRMLKVNRVRYICDLDSDARTKEQKITMDHDSRKVMSPKHNRKDPKAEFDTERKEA